MAIFYTSVRHWNPGQIGILIACQSLVGIVLQSGVGHLIDNSHHKRILTASAAAVVALCATGIALLPNYGVQIVVQLVIGAAITVFPAATGAFALGMSEESELTGRVARNETFTHSGNVIFAILAGVVGTFLVLGGIFYTAALFAAGMAVAVMFISTEHVDYEAARGGQKQESGDKENEPTGFRQLFSDKRILTFTLAVVLFNVANQATLPLVGEILSKANHGAGSAWQVAAAVAVAEVTMVLIAMFAGKKADSWGRKPLFLLAFAFLALRNGLNLASHNAFYLIGLQVFDGVAAALYGVLLTLVTADLAKGTGRFNFLQGSIQSAMGLGGFLSNSAFGWVAKSAGFNVAFAGLSGFAILGGLLYQFRMPETRKSDGS